MLLDISSSGAFVELAGAVEIGSAVTVRLPTSLTSPLDLAGKVVRKGKMDKSLRHPDVEHLLVSVPGVGIRFTPLQPEQSTQLSQFLSTLEES